MIMNLSHIFTNLTILKVKMVSWNKNQDAIRSAADEVGLTAFRMGKDDLFDTDLQRAMLDLNDDISIKLGDMRLSDRKPKTKKQLLADICKLEARLVIEYESQSIKLDAEIKELLSKN